MAAALLVWHAVFPQAASPWLKAADVLLAAGFALLWIRELISARSPREAARRRRVELLLLSALGLSLGLLFLLPDPVQWEIETGLQQQMYEIKFAAIRVFLFACVWLQVAQGAARILAAGWRAEFLLVGSFLAGIGAGTILLALPAAAAKPDAPISWMEAFFTATSAMCVTGLVVRDTGSDFSTTGQTVILLLFQMGGLGIVTFVALISSLSSKTLPVPQMAAFRRVINLPEMGDIRRRIAAIVGITMLVEAGGAALLFAFADPAMGLLGRIGWAAFHSVSAFCNAGFALHPMSLEFAVAHPGINFTVMALIIMGGLGFLVIPEVLSALWRGRRALLPDQGFRRGMLGLRWPRFSVQVRLSLWVTAILLVAGTIGFWLLERHHLLAGRGTGESWMAAAFQAVTARTAGFNTLPVGALQNASLLFLTFLMVVGGCPVSTAGGIKTVTLGVLALGIKALVTGRDRIEVFGRMLPARAIFATLNVFALYVCSASAGLLAITVFDPTIPLRDAAFETVSALSTVGLSTGITAGLSGGSKLTLCVLMFIGRVGPIALVLSVFQATARVDYDFPSEDVVVG